MDPAIKYGGGDKGIQMILSSTSSIVKRQERLQILYATTSAQFSTQENLTNDKKQLMVNMQEDLNSLNQEVIKHLRDIIKRVEELKGKNDDFSD
ncbi:MAG: hypothetical protein LC672_00675 [Acidobacteria bacterium]|nr:hypothetical protein [Acidobacteriota bacterium]